MDILLLVLGCAGLLVGLAGAVLPLPGPPLSFAGLLCLHVSSYADLGQITLYSLGFITLAVTVLDYYVPIWGVKNLAVQATALGAPPLVFCLGSLLSPHWAYF